MPKTLLIFVASLLLSGCDLLGLGPDPRISQREADAKAIGGACRHGLRSIEDCYTLNKGINKAAIYAGWREMDEYMRENKLETIEPQLPPPEGPGKKKKKPVAAEETAPEGNAKAAPESTDKVANEGETKADPEKKSDKH